MPNSTDLNNTHIQDFLFENFVGDIREWGAPIRPWIEPANDHHLKASRMLKVPVSLTLAGLFRSSLVAHTAFTLLQGTPLQMPLGRKSLFSTFTQTPVRLLLSHISASTYRSYNASASNIRTKDIFAKTQTGAPVDVMCDPETVRVSLALPRQKHDEWAVPFFFLRSTTMLVSNAGMVILYALLQVFRKKVPSFFFVFRRWKKT